jgi:hypothetical protein
MCDEFEKNMNKCGSMVGVRKLAANFAVKVVDASVYLIVDASVYLQLRPLPLSLNRMRLMHRLHPSLMSRLLLQVLLLIRLQ